MRCMVVPSVWLVKRTISSERVVMGVVKVW